MADGAGSIRFINGKFVHGVVDDDDAADAAEGKRKAEDADGAQASKRGKGAAAGAEAEAFPGYRLDAASGWYISTTDPAWQYDAARAIFYCATDCQYYRQDAATQEYTRVVYDDAGNEVAAASEPATPAVEYSAGLGGGPIIGHVADHTFMQGRRPTQEDRHTMLADYHKQLTGLGVSASFYAVYDGHTGEACSEFAAKQLHKDLAKNLKAAGSPLTEGTVKKAIVDACRSVDKEFLRIAKIRKARDGCCCIAVLILASTMFVINIGDSRAVLASDGKAVRLSEDHKPERADEKTRIEAAGGHVLKFGSTHRVTTNEALAWHQQKFKKGSPPVQIAVARSFGDYSLKVPRPLLISTPEILVRTLGDKDSLVLLGCDGVWDVLSDQRAVETALNAGKAGKTPKEIAGAVVSLAFERGSTDNISVVAICLQADKS